MHLAVVGAIYGFWYSGTKDMQYARGVAIAITGITVASAALMCMHNRVITELHNFMAKCEKHSAGAGARAEDRSFLFYFCSESETPAVDAPAASSVALSPGTESVLRSFHSAQKMLQRLVLATILIGSNVVAICLIWHDRDWVRWFGVGGCLASSLIMFLDLLPAGWRHIRRKAIWRRIRNKKVSVGGDFEVSA